MITPDRTPDQVVDLALLHHLLHALDEERVIALHLVEDLHRSGLAVTRNDDLGIEPAHHLDGGKRVRKAHGWPQIVESLATQVMTLFEREDIEALSKALYKIPKTVEKIGERILLAPQFLEGIDLSRPVAMLEKATETLLMMVRELRRSAPVEEVKARNAELQHIEGEVDKMMNELLGGLYQMQTGPGRALFLKDLYELLERATDRCRDAGNVIIQIVLKST